MGLVRPPIRRPLLYQQQANPSGNEPGLEELAQLVAELKRDSATVRTEIEAVKRETKELRLDIERLEVETERLKRDVEGLKQETTTIKYDLESVERDASDLKETLVMLLQIRY
ncbi:hypothetical protein DFS33DRAFT_1486680 [Desarmillaria ectypa]|nr:hypothetical protein DFS33DRAFT_1486680 [Desarmillaria ectypa]